MKGLHDESKHTDLRVPYNVIAKKISAPRVAHVNTLDISIAILEISFNTHLLIRRVEISSETFCQYTQVAYEPSSTPIYG